MSGGCEGLEAPNVPASSRPSFGELVYRVLETRMEASSTCSTEYVAELEVHHSDFVTTFDHVVENGVADRFPDLLGGTIKPFVDDDKLPRLVDQLAATLALLVSDEFDPNRETIEAFVDLSEAQTLLESSIAIQAVATILEDPTITDKVHTLAAIAQEDDGVTYLMDDLFDVASYALASDATPSTCTGVETPDAQTTLLRTDGFVANDALAFASPFYLARPDAHGNPRAAFYDGAIVPPFVDADGDLSADVDAEGEPIDANGARIDIPMIGEDGAAGRDEFGRAIDGEGRLYYDYYDVERTALSYTMQLGADVFETGAHRQLPLVIDAVLGDPEVCGDGTNCRSYASEGNLVADLVWLAFEVAEYGRISVLMHTLTALFSTDPATADQLLVALGDAIRAVDAAPISITDPTLTRGVAGLLPLVSEILSAPNSAGKPTARLVVDAFEALGAEAADLPSNTNYLLTHQYDADAPGGTESIDLSLPRYVHGDDNRTGLEQLVEMFAYADCGFVGPTSAGGNVTQNLVFGVFSLINSSIAGAPALLPGTVSEVLVELVSHMQTGGVQNLITLVETLKSVDALQGVMVDAFSDGVYLGTIEILPGLGCSASDAAQAVAHLDALQELTASSSLEWLIPMSRAFVEQGQLRTLIDIFSYIADDLRKDEGPGGPGSSAFRQLSPILESLTAPADPADPHSTPFHRIGDGIALLVDVPASDGNGSAVDVLFDALAYMSEPRTVETRPIAGTTPVVVPNATILGEILEKVALLQERLMAGDAGPNLSSMLDAITPILTETTGAGASRAPANPNLRLLIATYTEVLADATALPSDAYLCYVHDLQTESAAFFGTKHFATLVRILNHLVTSPNAAGLENSILSLMRANPERRLEMYGRVLQLAAGALSSNASSESLAQILDWLGASLDASGAGGMREMVATLDELLGSDDQGSILTMARTMLAPGPLASRERPIRTFANLTSDLSAIDSTNACLATGTNLDPAELEELIDGVSDFLHRDPSDGRSTGIEQIWDLVGTIAPAE